MYFLRPFFRGRPFVGGNWKLNGSFASIAKLAEAFNAGGPAPNTEVVIFPTMLALHSTQSLLAHAKVGAQDVSAQKGFGAFTGEISAQLLVEAGIEYTLTGHSERRSTVAAESSELIARKTLHAIEAGLIVVLCIGEQLEERDAGKTLDVLKEQMARRRRRVVWVACTGFVAFLTTWIQCLHARVQERLCRPHARVRLLSLPCRQSRHALTRAHTHPRHPITTNNDDDDNDDGGGDDDNNENNENNHRSQS